MRSPKPYDLPFASRAQAFTTPQAQAQAGEDAPLWVTATVEEASEVPEANSTPYGDMVMSLRLSGLQATRAADLKRLPEGEILLYAWGLRGQQPTATAGWKKGRRVTVRVVPWRAVEDEYSSFNRTELEGEAARGLQVFWCEAAK